ncbi:MAG: alpha-L-fucosidase [Verrucomicrobiae bacterium]|nr:alpha-L-fucosidase [Verrucomicrobiae bacterium]
MNKPRTWIPQFAALFLACFVAPALAVNAEPPAPPRPAVRVPQTSLGITQLPNEKLDWFLDGKFGMFIHWGLYSGVGRGEWVMEHEAISPEKYRQYPFPESGEAYFDAADYHPEAWAQLARDAGMKWMCLTTRHHDGFSLFDSPHPNAFTSVQTLHRDLVAEYVKACRGAGLRVGIYYSPLSWRYPGYYDVTGTNCQPNKFGYKTDPAHRENARLMKEENYANVKKLLTSYGKIDHIYWDGGWLAQKGADADAAFFHEPGKYLDPANRWPVSPEWQDYEAGTGKPLGIMGMVRKYQPDAITNLRYGWMGDIIEEEGPRETTGTIRSSEICDKNLTIQNGGWGYNSNSIAKGNILSLDQLVRYMADCTVRNMTFLLNVTPDRHGVIPEVEQQRLREMGAWMNKMGDAIYGTRGGPWQPVDRQYGYCYKDSTVFVHLLKDYAGNAFTLPPLGKLRVKKAYAVYDGKPLPFEGDSTISIRDIDWNASPADSVVAVVYDQPIQSVWKN